MQKQSLLENLSSNPNASPESLSILNDLTNLLPIEQELKKYSTPFSITIHGETFHHLKDTECFASKTSGPLTPRDLIVFAEGATDLSPSGTPFPKYKPLYRRYDSIPPILNDLGHAGIKRVLRIHQLGSNPPPVPDCIQPFADLFDYLHHTKNTGHCFTFSLEYGPALAAAENDSLLAAALMIYHGAINYTGRRVPNRNLSIMMYRAHYKPRTKEILLTIDNKHTITHRFLHACAEMERAAAFSASRETVEGIGMKAFFYYDKLSISMTPELRSTIVNKIRAFARKPHEAPPLLEEPPASTYAPSAIHRMHLSEFISSVGPSKKHLESLAKTSFNQTLRALEPLVPHLEVGRKFTAAELRELKLNPGCFQRCKQKKLFTGRRDQYIVTAELAEAISKFYHLPPYE